jgi:hypothetical protein
MEESINISALNQRHLAWEGSYNVRDIGGYSTLDGRDLYTGKPFYERTI